MWSSDGNGFISHVEPAIIEAFIVLFHIMLFIRLLVSLLYGEIVTLKIVLHVRPCNELTVLPQCYCGIVVNVFTVGIAEHLLN